MDICEILTYHSSRGQYDLGTRETLSVRDRSFFLKLLLTLRIGIRGGSQLKTGGGGERAS